MIQSMFHMQLPVLEKILRPMIVYLVTDAGRPRRELVAVPVGADGRRSEVGALAHRDDAELEFLEAGHMTFWEVPEDWGRAVTRWLRLCAEAGMAILLADPGRAWVPQDGLTERATYSVPTLLELEDTETRKVTV